MYIFGIIPDLYSDSGYCSLHDIVKCQSPLIPLKYDRNPGFAALLQKSWKWHNPHLLFQGKHSLHKFFVQRLSENDWSACLRYSQHNFHSWTADNFQKVIPAKAQADRDDILMNVSAIPVHGFVYHLPVSLKQTQLLSLHQQINGFIFFLIFHKEFIIRPQTVIIKDSQNIHLTIFYQNQQAQEYVQVYFSGLYNFRGLT